MRSCSRQARFVNLRCPCDILQPRPYSMTSTNSCLQLAAREVKLVRVNSQEVQTVKESDRKQAGPVTV